MLSEVFRRQVVHSGRKSVVHHGRKRVVHLRAKLDMLIGGIVLVGSDWLSRVYLGGLDIGVITSLIGAPMFCWLLRRRMTQQEF